MDMECLVRDETGGYFEACRTCMSRNNELKPLFIDDKDLQKPLTEVLLQVTGLIVTENDGLPPQICTSCISSAENAMAFKEMCRQSDLNFRKGLVGEDLAVFKPFIKKEYDVECLSQNLIKENIKPALNDVQEDGSEDTSPAAPYKCGLCCVSFYICSKLKEHVKASHGNQYENKKADSKNKYSCSVCSKSFRSKNGHHSHFKKCSKKISVKEEAVSDSDSDTPLSARFPNLYRNVEDEIISAEPGVMELDTIDSESSNAADNVFDVGVKDFICDDIKTESESMDGMAYSCNECDMKFTKEIYEAHMKSVHGERNKRKRSARGATKNGDMDTAVGKLISPQKLKCTHCRRTFSKESALAVHIKKHEKKSNEIHKCEICQREFKRRAHLENHMLTHSIDKGFKCTLCPRAFSSEQSLNVHIENHKNGKRHQCPHCEKGFNMLSTLKDHIRTHTGEKPFLCSICGRGFSQSTNLKEHVRRHQGYKPFKCNFCSQTFVSKGELEAHLRKHSGAHPFVCDECGSGFTTSSSLVKHKRIHTGERPYTCDFCPMRFTALGTMKNHRRTHTGEKPYKCQYCDKAFVQKNDLVTHTRTHTGERPYVCTICGHAFRQSSALKTHFKIHGGQTEYIPASMGPSRIEESSTSLNIMTPKSENSNL